MSTFHALKDHQSQQSVSVLAPAPDLSLWILSSLLSLSLWFGASENHLIKHHSSWHVGLRSQMAEAAVPGEWAPLRALSCSSFSLDLLCPPLSGIVLLLDCWTGDCPGPAKGVRIPKRPVHVACMSVISPFLWVDPSSISLCRRPGSITCSEHH